MLFLNKSNLRNPGASFKRLGHRRVCLELLERLERMEVRIRIVQANDKAHSYQVVLGQVVQEGSAIGFGVLAKT